MTFIEKNLAPNEEIIWQAGLHKIIYLGAIIWAFLGLAFYYILQAGFGVSGSWVGYCALAFGAIALIKFGNAQVRQISTELAITDQRFIAKFGFISREVLELPLSKIESVVVEQTVLERILDSGTIAIHGTGSSLAPVRDIDCPVEFRNKLNAAIESAKEQN